MKIPETTKTVVDTVENLQICKKYCGACPTCKGSRLSKSPTECTLLRTGKIISFSKSKNYQVLLSGM